VKASNRRAYLNDRADTEALQRRKETAKRWRRDNPAMVLLAGARTRAARDQAPCTITVAEIEMLLQPMMCAATGTRLEWRCDGSRYPLQPSLDRIAAREGYVPGNVRVVSWIFNRAKGSDADSDVLQMALALVAFSSN
jgi:hypothetical protein